MKFSTHPPSSSFTTQATTSSTPPAAQDSVDCQTACQTMLWIGDRDSDHLRDTYERTERICSQIAYRSDLRQAVKRPASEVDWIVVSSKDRAPLCQDDLNELGRRHPQSRRLLMRGPLCEGQSCEGMRVGESGFFGSDQCDWLHAAEVLASLGDSSWNQPPSTSPPLTNPVIAVAIVASHYSMAEPLLEIAEQSRCAALWCRQPSASIVRGVDAVWWDDSFAGPTDAAQWHHRLQSMGPQVSRHAWITNRTHWLQVNQAQEAGVSLVLTKPYRVELLQEFLGVPKQCDHTSGRATAQAA